MKPKIKLMTKFVDFFTADWVTAITLAPFGIYVAEEKYLKNKKLINHESIHWKQQFEMLIIFFYIWYIIEWFIRLFVNPGNAYKSISFEREANKFEKDDTYLTNRKAFAWLKFMRKKK